LGDPTEWSSNKFLQTYEPIKEDVLFLSERCKTLQEATLAGSRLLAHVSCLRSDVHASPQTDKRPAHFFDVYNGLNLDRKKDYHFLEIGNRWCGALWGWRVYLPNAKIYGLDIDKQSQVFQTNNPDTGIDVYQGDQTDVNLLKKIHKDAEKLDIIIDDGGHTMTQMKTSFETLWPLLEDGGIYIIEDLQCCYWPSFEGGLKKENSFIEYIKSLVDNLHAPFYKSESVKAARAEEFMIDEPSNYYDKSIGSIEIYDSIAVIRKKVKEKLKPNSIEHNFSQEILNFMAGFEKEHNKYFEPTFSRKEKLTLSAWFHEIDNNFVKLLGEREEKMKNKREEKMKSEKISFIIPSRNNLRYLKWCYNSIRKNLGYRHEICIADDE